MLDTDDAGILADAFKGETPVRPYMGPRSQHDQD
jgi:hypothetical protein